MKTPQFVIMLGLLASSFTSYASVDIPSKPDRCPAITAIQNAGLQVAVPAKKSYLYSVYQVNSYNTSQTWGFIIENVVADTTSDAIQRATAALNTLAGGPSPTYNTHRKVYVCSYVIGAGYSASAVTPYV